MSDYIVQSIVETLSRISQDEGSRKIGEDAAVSKDGREKDFAIDKKKRRIWK